MRRARRGPKVIGLLIRGPRACDIHAIVPPATTLYDWINRYPELHEAIQIGVDVFNPCVERALADAIGFL